MDTTTPPILLKRDTSTSVIFPTITTTSNQSPQTTVDSSTPLMVPLTRPTMQQRLANLCSRKFLTILLLGQLLSFCITATTIFTTKLAQGDNPVSIPTTQSFLNYLVLGIVYTSVTIYKKGFWGWIEIMRQRALYCKYMNVDLVLFVDCLMVCMWGVWRKGVS